MAEQKNAARKTPAKAEDNKLKKTETVKTEAIKAESMKTEPKEEKRMAQEALGMVETRGLVASIEAADTRHRPSAFWSPPPG